MSKARPAWQALAAHRDKIADHPLKNLFAAEPGRSKRMQAEACGLFLDYSKNRLDTDTLTLLHRLARDAGVAERRAAMFAGERINTTEGRAVLHTALRKPAGSVVEVDDTNVVEAVVAMRERIRRFSDAMRHGD